MEGQSRRVSHQADEDPGVLPKHHDADRLSERRAPVHLPEAAHHGRRETEADAVPRLQPLVPPGGAGLMERAAVCGVANKTVQTATKARQCIKWKQTFP